MQGLNVVAAFTLSALALYFFVFQSDKSSKFISAVADGYTKTVTTLQGR